MEDIRPNALDIAFNVLKIRYAEYDRMIQMESMYLLIWNRHLRMSQ